MARKKVIDLDCEATVKFEKAGQSTEGYYIGNKEITTEFGPSKLHVFQGESGNFGVFGSSKLDEKLAKVPAGCMTFITFNGKVKIPGGKTMKRFEVEFDDDISIDVGETQVNFQRSEEPAEESSEGEQFVGDPAEAEAEEAQDVDDDTIEAGEAEEEEPVEPKNVVKKPLVKGKPLAPTVSAKQQSNVQGLLSKSKR